VQTDFEGELRQFRDRRERETRLAGWEVDRLFGEACEESKSGPCQIGANMVAALLEGDGWVDWSELATLLPSLGQPLTFLLNRLVATTKRVTCSPR
jgi:hypothetical protein